MVVDSEYVILSRARHCLFPNEAKALDKAFVINSLPMFSVDEAEA